MTHWLSQVPHLPAWSGWLTIKHLAQGIDPWPDGRWTSEV